MKHTTERNAKKLNLHFHTNNGELACAYPLTIIYPFAFSTRDLKCFSI